MTTKDVSHEFVNVTAADVIGAGHRLTDRFAGPVSSQHSEEQP